MRTRGFEELEVYQLSEKLADSIWDMVRGWPVFAKDTVGKQMVRAADSIGANIAEGSGRGTYQDNRRFVRIARGSLLETRHFLRRAFRRHLLSSEEIAIVLPMIKELAPRLNAYLRSIGPTNENASDDEQMTNDK
ncbi:MAG TPA: four helix bundle protein [Tepidisphaeraceae bacterium]|jgi:four helix bundle protein